MLQIKANRKTEGTSPMDQWQRICLQCRSHRNMGLIPGSGRFPGEGHGNSLKHSCLENPMDREAWQVQFIGHKE